MKKSILLLVLIFSAYTSLAQDSKFSATLSYPLTIGDNFLEEYSGYVDVGLQYSFVNLEIVRFGISANATFLAITQPENEGEKFTSFLIHPKLFGELLLGQDRKIRPSLGVGYGFNKFNNRSDTTGTGLSDINRVYEGIVLSLGLAYNVSERIFILAQYDWAKIDRSLSVFGEESFTSRGNLIKIGVGLRL